MHDDSDEMRGYYSARAPEYDRVYAKPERQADIQTLREWLPAQFAGRRVLDVACGTGFWTEIIAPVVAELVGVDAAASTLAIARARINAPNVQLVVGDVYDVPVELGEFNAAFLGFWFSHVAVSGRREFLASLSERLVPGALVVLVDNLYVEGSNLAVVEHDADGNTYQERRLDDGTSHRVLKNFPTEQELNHAATGLATDPAYRALEYFWTFQYRAAKVKS